MYNDIYIYRSLYRPYYSRQTTRSSVEAKIAQIYSCSAATSQPVGEPRARAGPVVAALSPPPAGGEAAPRPLLPSPLAPALSAATAAAAIVVVVVVVLVVVLVGHRSD